MANVLSLIRNLLRPTRRLPLAVVVALCSSVAVSQVPPEYQGELYKKAIPVTTGTNGYEEYCAAADYMQEHVAEYMPWTPPSSERTAQQLTELQDQLKGASEVDGKVLSAKIAFIK